MLVSVIIPTYNRSSFVVRAIESVLDQTHKDFELIVIDDGSTDNTRDLLNKYSSQITYKYINQSGVSNARNVGIEMARGDYVAFLDSDDLWLPEKLAYQAEYFESNPDIKITQTEEVWIRNGKRVNPKFIHQKHSGWIFEKCIPLCIISPSAVMIKRDVFSDIGMFDVSMPACEDYDLWLRAALKYQIVTLPKALIQKQGGHVDQLSNQWGLDIWRIYALEKIMNNNLLSDHQRKLVRDDIVRRALIVANGARKRERFDEFKTYQEIAERYTI